MKKSETDDIFARNVPGMTEALRGRTVGIAGCGGLGSNVAVALVRSGVEHLVLVDSDVVEASNLNRQHYFREDIGESKVRALARHLRAIRPDVLLELHRVRLTEAMVPDIFGPVDLLVEAFDLAGNKLFLIDAWCRLHPDRPIVVGNGLGGCGRTAALKVWSASNIVFCGDGETSSDAGLCAARVALVANMQANVALELLTGGTVEESP